MPDFRVVWEIDITAETAEEAARKALAIQRNPFSIATVFNVESGKEPSKSNRIDLTEIDESLSIGSSA